MEPTLDEQIVACSSVRVDFCHIHGMTRATRKLTNLIRDMIYLKKMLFEVLNREANVVLLVNKLDICNKCDIYVKRVVDRHTSPEGDWSPSMTVKLLIDGLTFFLTLIQDMYIKLCEITKSSTVRLVKVYCYELPDLEHPEILDLCETIELYLEQEISLLEMNIVSIMV